MTDAIKKETEEYIHKWMSIASHLLSTCVASTYLVMNKDLFSNNSLSQLQSTLSGIFALIAVISFCAFMILVYWVAIKTSTRKDFGPIGLFKTIGKGRWKSFYITVGCMLLIEFIVLI